MLVVGTSANNVERLKPDGWKENRQFLAKSLVQLGEAEEAVVWLERAAAMPVKNPDVRTQQNLLNVTKRLHVSCLVGTIYFQDEIAQEDIEKMLSQYQRPS